MLECITEDKILFASDDEFAYLYNDYLLQLRDLRASITKLRVYEAYKSMEFLEYQNMRSKMQNADG